MIYIKEQILKLKSWLSKHRLYLIFVGLSFQGLRIGFVITALM